jgi:hypothetical protein
LADRFDEDFEVEVAAAQARSLIMDCFRYWSFAESLLGTGIPEAATEGSPSARSVETSEALPGDPSSPTTEDFGAGALLSATNRDAERAKGQVWFGTGLQFLWGGAYAEAARAFEAASGCAPDDPTYYYFRAISQYAEGRRAVAEQTLVSAVQLEADHPVPNLGRMMQRVQGPERRWMEIARRRAQVGPYRPREAHDQPARVQSRP